MSDFLVYTCELVLLSIVILFGLTTAYAKEAFTCKYMLSHIY